VPDESRNQPDLEALDERLDELEEEIDETRRSAEEHDTIPGKKEPSLVDPNPEGPDGEDGFPNPPVFG
jgi:hypothetical protein